MKTKFVHSSPCSGWCKIYERTDVEKEVHHDHDGYEICRHFKKPECPHKEWLNKWIKQVEEHEARYPLV